MAFNQLFCGKLASADLLVRPSGVTFALPSVSLLQDESLFFCETVATIVQTVFQHSGQGWCRHRIGPATLTGETPRDCQSHNASISAALRALTFVMNANK
jgi:hypothetical protein